MKLSNISKQSQQSIHNIQTKQFNFIKLIEKKTKKRMQQNNTIIAKVIKKQKFETNIVTNITNQNNHATSKLTKGN